MSLPQDGRLSREEWIQDQADKAETIARNGTTDGVGRNGMPVVLLTTRGRKSGTLRRVPVMRVEHDGQYAVVASQAGAPEHPAWYHNVTADPRVDLQDGAVTNATRPARWVVRKETCGGNVPSRSIRTTPTTSAGPTDPSRSSCWTCEPDRVGAPTTEADRRVAAARGRTGRAHPGVRRSKRLGWCRAGTDGRPPGRGWARCAGTRSG